MVMKLKCSTVIMVIWNGNWYMKKIVLLNYYFLC